MNVLKQSMTSKLSLFSHPSRKWRLLLYSTTYTLNPPKHPKRSQLPQPPPPPRKTPPPPPKPPCSSSRVEAVKLADWPRPSEIPYQAKVANSVNLIGHIKAPVKFWTSPDGKYWACTVILQENGPEKSCLIPVVFEGDLAHVVTFHVKENDCVYVIGRLSEDPLPLVLSETPGRLHLRVENINFVQGFEKQWRRKKLGGNLSPESDDIVLASNDEGKSESMVSPGEENYQTRTRSVGTNKGEDSDSTRSVGTKKGEDSGLDSWRDLVQNSSEWGDYREQKSKGLVSNKYPDFKHKDTGTPLWLGSAPEWVLGGLESLKFDVPASKQKQAKDTKEDLWRSLAENPYDWWDNRLNKKNPKAPDFKHKTSGEALWLNNSPGWVLSELPPVGEK